jgi:hypothetical protein
MDRQRSAGRKNRVLADSEETESESESEEEERSPAAACAAAPAGGAAANIDSLLGESSDSDSDGDIADFQKKKAATIFMKSSQGTQANQQTSKPANQVAR